MNTASATAAPRIPAIGDRVIVDVTIMGETLPTEVIIAQVDTDSKTRKTRIIGRPEGTLAMAFARTEWREVTP